MPAIVNLERCFDQFNDTYSPKIVGELNGQLVMVVRVEGDKVPWHIHDHEDEMFLVLDGELEVQERDRTSVLRNGEFIIVPMGVEHRVLPRGHVRLLLFEPASISHTGSVETEITKKTFDRLEV